MSVCVSAYAHMRVCICVRFTSEQQLWRFLINSATPRVDNSSSISSTLVQLKILFHIITDQLLDTGTLRMGP